jgi:hypothetical protein
MCRPRNTTKRFLHFSTLPPFSAKKTDAHYLRSAKGLAPSDNSLIPHFPNSKGWEKGKQLPQNSRFSLTRLQTTIRTGNAASTAVERNWTMDAVERVARVVRREVPDRVPVGLHNFLMACRMHGGPFDEILRDGEAMVEAQLKFWRMCGHDLLMPEIGVCAEAEALGCKRERADAHGIRTPRRPLRPRWPTSYSRTTLSTWRSISDLARNNWKTAVGTCRIQGAQARIASSAAAR